MYQYLTFRSTKEGFYIIGKTNRTNIKNKSYKFHVCQFETSALFVLLLSETFCTFAILGI